MTTAIVILNWNGRDFLKKYLPSLIDSVSDNEKVDVIVADNASEDGSIALLKEEFPSVRIIRFNKNHGFAGGYNKALRMLDHDCFLLLNSDIEVCKGWFEPLEEWMEIHRDCGICGPKLHCIDKPDTFEYAGAAGGYIDRFGYPFCRGRVMQRLEKDCGQYDLPADVMWVSGAALMIRKSVFDEIGGFDKDFFAHMEEIDLCWRARLSGWRVCIVPRSSVCHVGGGTLPQGSAKKLFLNYRNNLLLMYKNLPATCSIWTIFETISKLVDQNEGANLAGLCTDCFNELEEDEKKALLGSCIKYGDFVRSTTIFKRMVLDGLSAAVYLFKGQGSYFSAVIRAHREFRRMRKKYRSVNTESSLREIINGDRLDIAGVILTDTPMEGNPAKSTFGLKGIWNRWTVWQSFRHGDNIFEVLKDKII